MTTPEQRGPAGLSATKQALLEQWRSGARLAPRESSAPVPTASTQQRQRASIQQAELWQLHRASPTTTSSNISYAAVLDGEVDAGALGEAIAALSLRHDTLRTTLSATNDGSGDGGAAIVWQHVHDEPLQLQRVDVSDIAPEAALQRAHELANQMASRPFDLVAGPLARIALYRLGPRRHLLAVVVHHSVGDGWSLAIAMGETAALYDAVLRGERVDLPPLPLRYADFSEWQWRWMEGPEAREHARYWESRVRDHRAVVLPGDVGDGERRGLGSGLVDIVVPPELTAKVRAVAAAEKASVYMVMLAAFAALTRERTGEPVVSVGAPVACRTRPEIHPLVGCFASVIPMIITVENDASFRDLVRVVRAEAASALAHEDYPMPMYLLQVEPDREFGERPLYSAMFALQPPMASFRLAGVELEQINLDRGQTRAKFAVHLWNVDPSIHGTIAYSTSVFSRALIDSMTERYLEILDAATTDPGRSCGEL